jgi:hypothetical protein
MRWILAFYAIKQSTFRKNWFALFVRCLPSPHGNLSQSEKSLSRQLPKPKSSFFVAPLLRMTLRRSLLREKARMRVRTLISVRVKGEEVDARLASFLASQVPSTHLS